MNNVIPTHGATGSYIRVGALGYSTTSRVDSPPVRTKHTRLVSEIVCVLALCVFSLVPAQAASPQMKPVLKAIDPSQAKIDVPPPVLPPPSPNPLGRITGAPVSPRRRTSLPPPPPPTSYLPAPSPPPDAYPQARPQNDYPSAYSAPPPAYGSYNQAPAAASPNNSFPSEDLIPEFGKALPFDKLRNYQAPATGYGQGFSTQAPVNATGGSMEEARVNALEQAAFGATYPEHDVPDRIDHLEKEVFGQASEGNLSNRLAKLEMKLSGQGAFAQQAN